MPVTQSPDNSLAEDVTMFDTAQDFVDILARMSDCDTTDHCSSGYAPSVEPDNSTRSGFLESMLRATQSGERRPRHPRKRRAKASIAKKGRIVSSAPASNILGAQHAAISSNEQARHVNIPSQLLETVSSTGSALTECHLSPEYWSSLGLIRDKKTGAISRIPGSTAISRNGTTWRRWVSLAS